MAEVGGVIAGAQGASKARDDFRDRRAELQDARTRGVGSFEALLAALGGDPLIKGAQDLFLGQQQNAPDPETTGALFGSAADDVFGLGGKGISNPEVQNQLFRRNFEESIAPQQEQSRSNLASELAARGLSRSGIAAKRFGQQDQQFREQSGDLRRDLSLAGAEADFNESLQRSQAASNLFNLGSQASERIAGAGSQFGFQRAGFGADIMDRINRLRQSVPLGLLGNTPQNQSQAISSGLFQGAGGINRGVAGIFG